jgi:pimeloyl-ACP methyl ester carboxylesterase
VLSLTGVGERTHLFARHVNLATHVEDVVSLIEFEQADGCTLVGHSYGGNVLTGVADRLRGRVAHYVFLDAAIPPDGVASWSWSDINTPEAKASRVTTFQDQGRGPGLPPPPPSAFGVTDPAQAAWLARHLRPMPAGSYLEPIALRNGGSRGLNRTYIRCVDPVYTVLAPIAERVERDPTWKFTTIACGHDAMVIAPQLLTDMLIEVAVA